MGSSPNLVSAQETTAETLAAFTKFLPGLMEVFGQNILPFERKQLGAQREIAPQKAQLDLDLLDTVGRESNRVGGEIAAQNAEQRVASETKTLKGLGQDLVRSVLGLQEEVDPEAFTIKRLLGDSVAKLFKLNEPDLSGSERAETERQLARENVQRGNSGNPSNISAIENATKFGAAFDKKRANLTNAIQTAAGSIGATKSGVDVLQQATGRSGIAGNVGQAQFNPAATVGSVGQATMGIGQNFLNQVGQNAQQANQINSQRETGLDKFAKVAGAAGSLTSAL